MSSDPVPRASDKSYAASKEVKFRYDVENAPRGVLLLILTHPAGKHLLGMLTGRPDRDADVCGWSLLVGRDKEEEARRGLFSTRYNYQGGEEPYLGPTPRDKPKSKDKEV
jgi:hypothetical protein